MRVSIITLYCVVAAPTLFAQEDLASIVKRFAQRNGAGITQRVNGTEYTARIRTPEDATPALITYTQRHDGTNVLDITLVELRTDRVVLRQYLDGEADGQLDQTCTVVARTLPEAYEQLRDARPRTPSQLDRNLFQLYVRYVREPDTGRP